MIEISLCMIVKNEEETLGRCLESMEGLVDENTVYVANHFTHNGGVTYDEMLPAAKEYGFLVSYDGMEVEI